MHALIIDDHPLVADAISTVLQELFPDIHITFVASGEEGLDHIELHPSLDLIILDMMLPGLGGLTILHRIRTLCPAIPVVILSGECDPESIKKSLQYGAAGFIPKSSPRATMLNAFRLVIAGEIYVPPEAITYSALPPAQGSEFAQFEMSPRQRKKIEALGLTPREMDVLVLLVAGHSNKQIGRNLGIAEATIKAHVTNILRALDANNRTQVVYRLTRGDLV